MLILLDNGHGGMVGARYLTRGKRSPEVKPGLGIHEGEFNRDIVKRVCGYGHLADFEPGAELGDPEIVDLVPEVKNITLKERVARANGIKSFGAAHFRHKLFVSIHANAHGDGREWTKANGYTVFHYPGSKLGSRAAHVVFEELRGVGSIAPRRIDSRRFHVLKRTRMPALLVECGFMTNRSDARVLASDKGRDAIAGALLRAFAKMEVALWPGD